MPKDNVYIIIIIFCAISLFLGITSKQKEWIKALEWKARWVCNHYARTGDDVKVCYELYLPLAK